jgi:Right handed beta helix region
LQFNETIFFSVGSFSMVGPIVIGNSDHFLGTGVEYTSIKPTNATGDFISVSGGDAEVGGFSIRPTVTRTAGAVINITNTFDKIHDLQIYDPFDGIVWTANTAGITKVWNIDFLGIGGNIHNLFRSGPIASGTITTVTVSHCTYNNGAGSSTISGPLVNLDSGTDTFHMSDCVISKSTGSDANPVVQIQSTGAAQVPSYTRFTDLTIEADSTANALQIDNAYDFSSENGFYGLGANGIRLNGGTKVKFHGDTILSNQHEGMFVGGGSDFQVIGNKFLTNALAASNTFDAIEVSGGSINFTISDNRISQTGAATTLRYGINIASASAASFSIKGERGMIDGFATNDINNASTSNQQDVEYNGQPGISGFGTSPSIAEINGNDATITVGNPAAATGVVSFIRAVPNRWWCTCQDVTTQSVAVASCLVTATSTTSVTLGNFSDVMVSGNWIVGDKLVLKCSGR